MHRMWQPILFVFQTMHCVTIPCVSQTMHYVWLFPVYPKQCTTCDYYLCVSNNALCVTILFVSQTMQCVDKLPSVYKTIINTMSKSVAAAAMPAVLLPLEIPAWKSGKLANPESPSVYWYFSCCRRAFACFIIKGKQTLMAVILQWTSGHIVLVSCLLINNFHHSIPGKLINAPSSSGKVARCRCLLLQLHNDQHLIHPSLLEPDMILQCMFHELLYLLLPDVHN